jgi:DegV family protein with EDD domain
MKIVTDSAADLSKEEAELLNIEIAPLYIQFPEGEVSSSQITPDDFYRRLQAIAPRIPTTAQPSTGIFSAIYQKLVEIGEEVISIHISSGLSGTIQSAQSGASQISEKLINLVDSFTLSGGQRFQVLAAALSAKAGKNKEWILERLTQIRQATEVVYTLDTLEYLQRGGRIGRVQALAGSLLHIKPVIHVDKADGKYSTISKQRTISKALDEMAEHIFQLYGNGTPLWVSVMHGQFVEQAQKLAEIVQSRVSVKKIEILRISPVLGVHTGPGIVGLAVVPVHLMEGWD